MDAHQPPVAAQQLIAALQAQPETKEEKEVKEDPWRPYSVWGEEKAVGVSGRLWCLGLKLLAAADFAGEVIADFLGITQSRYQFVINAHERHAYEMKMERLEEEEAMKAMEEKENQRMKQFEEQGGETLAVSEFLEDSDVHYVPISSPEPPAKESSSPSASSSSSSSSSASSASMPSAHSTEAVEIASV